MLRLIPYIAAAAAALLLAMFASPVSAHAELVSASPGPGEEIAGSPDEIVAEFSQDLDESRTSLEVRDADGSRVARGGELGDTPREFRLALPPLSPGVYEVRYTTFSAEDSELHRGRYSFAILAAPSPSPSPFRSASASPSPSPSASASPSAFPTEPLPEASPSPAATPAGEPARGGSGADMSVLIPIIAALAAAGVLGIWLFRRRAT